MTPNQIERLARLVSEKGWSAFDLLAHPELTTIEAITQMFHGLPSNEIDLSLDLLDDYIIIKDYSSAARSLMVALRDLAAGAPLLVTPIVDYQSERTKSGHSLHYEMSNFTGLFREKSILFRDDPKSKSSQDHDGIHVSVDDFIGTGSQFFTMIESVIRDGMKDTISHIAAICIQDSAKTFLEEAGYQVIALHVLGKGLDRLSQRRGLPRTQVASEYEKLEKKTACSPQYRLGRDETEALVTMKATPNNTLPIFWIEGKSEMARTIPQTKALSFRDRELFRAIYYHQQLPHDLLALGTSVLSSRLRVLEMAGYLKNTYGQLELTDIGQLAMLRMYGGQKPPMIDTWREAQLDPKSKKSQFVVGSSLASKLAREVSSGE